MVWSQYVDEATIGFDAHDSDDDDFNHENTPLNIEEILFGASFQLKKSKGVSVHKRIGAEAEIVIVDPLGICL